MGGGGGGGPVTNFTSGYSGQGGGRIIPGTSSNLASWSVVTSSTTAAQVFTVDNRYNSPGSLIYNTFSSTAFSAPPSSAGQVGRDNSYIGYSYVSGGTTYSEFADAGAGGGWGAQGGTSSVAGGAAGKAINTAGNTVTWIGGSNRVYGVVG